LKKLDNFFYNQDTVTVAKSLLGKLLVHETEGRRVSGKIVETEAYLGMSDKASHSYGGKRTQRVEAMYKKAGFSYVFMIYGMHYCFNVVTQMVGVPEAVLIRALEPVEGLDIMAFKRHKMNYSELSKVQIRNLTNGPGKLCSALQIDKKLNGVDLCSSELYIEDSDETFNIVASKRVGIDYAEEAKDFLLRFHIENNRYVSKYSKE
jgi:DNA-3-methyladenine glycosylase